MRAYRSRISVSAVVMLIFAVFTVTAHAGEFGDLKKQISDARDTLVTMLKNKDKRDAGQQKLVKDSADAVSASLAKMKAPAGKDAQYKELVDTWNAFKSTREKELVPAILASKQEEAEKIGGGVQKERMKKILELCDALGN